ncbi:hypothetical protein WN51_09850 [Melipona quadrifasciata]|uniref:Uncharacterized protein n=1 Tax=Melipona quadrifasciata TaxID=166423 RepID=A0A0M9A6M1_9HYME|nr:hypothetical protein WN51_09850 [Melipona quadrifasciata]
MKKISETEVFGTIVTKSASKIREIGLAGSRVEPKLAYSNIRLAVRTKCIIEVHSPEGLVAKVKQQRTTSQLIKESLTNNQNFQLIKELHVEFWFRQIKERVIKEFSTNQRTTTSSVQLLTKNVEPINQRITKNEQPKSPINQRKSPTESNSGSDEELGVNQSKSYENNQNSRLIKELLIHLLDPYLNHTLWMLSQDEFSKQCTLFSTAVEKYGICSDNKPRDLLKLKLFHGISQCDMTRIQTIETTLYFTCIYYDCLIDATLTAPIARLAGEVNATATLSSGNKNGVPRDPRMQEPSFLISVSRCKHLETASKTAGFDVTGSENLLSTGTAVPGYSENFNTDTQARFLGFCLERQSQHLERFFKGKIGKQRASWLAPRSHVDTFAPYKSDAKGLKWRFPFASWHETECKETDTINGKGNKSWGEPGGRTLLLGRSLRNSWLDMKGYDAVHTNCLEYRSYYNKLNCHWMAMFVKFEDDITYGRTSRVAVVQSTTQIHLVPTTNKQSSFRLYVAQYKLSVHLHVKPNALAAMPQSPNATTKGTTTGTKPDMQIVASSCARYFVTKQQRKG